MKSNDTLIVIRASATRERIDITREVIFVVSAKLGSLSILTLTRDVVRDEVRTTELSRAATKKESYYGICGT